MAELHPYGAQMDLYLQAPYSIIKAHNLKRSIVRWRWVKQKWNNFRIPLRTLILILILILTLTNPNPNPNPNSNPNPNTNPKVGRVHGLF